MGDTYGRYGEIRTSKETIHLKKQEWIYAELAS